MDVGLLAVFINWSKDDSKKRQLKSQMYSDLRQMSLFIMCAILSLESLP